MGAHSAGVFCLGADPLFGQIVKAGEPVLSALVNTLFYGKSPSMAKWFMLLPIVGGVAFASLKKGTDGAYALKFDETALIFGMIGNVFAAFKGSENKKLMEVKGLKDRMGGVANQFALTELLAFLTSVANTAKRVIVMVYMATVTGKALTEEQKIGAAIAIGGVLVYSVIDDLLKMVTGGDKKKKKSA